MKLSEFLIGTSKYGMGTIVSGAIGACAGYTFGTLSKGNPMLTAQVFAIAAVAAFIFRQCVENGFEDLRDRGRNFIYILGATAGGAAFTITLKNLEIISRIGTAVLAGLTVAINAYALYMHTERDYIFVD